MALYNYSVTLCFVIKPNNKVSFSKIYLIKTLSPFGYTLEVPQF